MVTVTICSDFGAPAKIKSDTVSPSMTLYFLIFFFHSTSAISSHDHAVHSHGHTFNLVMIYRSLPSSRPLWSHSWLSLVRGQTYWESETRSSFSFVPRFMLQKEWEWQDLQGNVCISEHLFALWHTVFNVCLFLLEPNIARYWHSATLTLA